MSCVDVVHSNGAPQTQTHLAEKKKKNKTKQNIAALSSHHQRDITQELLGADVVTHS